MDFHYMHKNDIGTDHNAFLGCNTHGCLRASGRQGVPISAPYPHTHTHTIKKDNGTMLLVESVYIYWIYGFNFEDLIPVRAQKRTIACYVISITRLDLVVVTIGDKLIESSRRSILLLLAAGLPLTFVCYCYMRSTARWQHFRYGYSILGPRHFRMHLWENKNNWTNFYIELFEQAGAVCTYTRQCHLWGVGYKSPKIKLLFAWWSFSMV